MLGPPASGKTTQADLLKAKLGLPVVALGGERVSDEAANSEMRKRVTQKDCRRGFIVDGYPLTATQAEYFDALLKELKLPAPRIIHLALTDASAWQRMESRAHQDDNPANAERRIVEYRRNAELLLARYPGAITVDASKSRNTVSALIQEALLH